MLYNSKVLSIKVNVRTRNSRSKISRRVTATTTMENSINLTGLKVDNIERIGSHYATTLNIWNKNFNENIDRIKDMGFDQYFINLWNYYFSYCEAGFANNTIDDVQLVIKGGIANA